MKQLKRYLVEEFPFILAAPALLWEIFFLYIPFILLVLFSFYHSGSFSLLHYYSVCSPVYFSVIIQSLIIAIITSLLCLSLAYPLAYFLVMHTSKHIKNILLFTLILPSWTSIIVQIYAWFFLLDKNSIITKLLHYMHIIPDNYHLVNSYGATLLVMVAVYLPFMILPIYTTLEKIDKRLFEASADLGATRYQTFKHIIFPISLPGVFAGLLLVFLPAFGEFAIPTLLGGSKKYYWGNIIVDKFLLYRDWQSGSAYAILGIVCSGSVILFMYIINKYYALKKQNSYKKLL